MAWNNGLERKRFDEEQEKLAAEYRAAGMTEEQIEQMHQFDLKVFNSTRRFFEHNQQSSEVVLEEIDDDKSPLFKKYLSALSVDLDSTNIKDRYWWIEEIENPQLLTAIKELSVDEIEFVTQIVFEELTQEEIAKVLGVSQAAVSQKLKKILKNLKKCL